MKHPIRHQNDGEQDTYSAMSALACPKSDTRTRQEDAHDLDINVILSRHGAAGLFRRQPTSGHINFDLDRHQALAAIADARRFWQRLPADLKDVYPSWVQVLAAMDDGTLKIILDKRNKNTDLNASLKKGVPNGDASDSSPNDR